MKNNDVAATTTTVTPKRILRMRVAPITMRSECTLMRQLGQYCERYPSSYFLDYSVIADLHNAPRTHRAFVRSARTWRFHRVGPGPNCVILLAVLDWRDHRAVRRKDNPHVVAGVICNTVGPGWGCKAPLTSCRAVPAPTVPRHSVVSWRGRCQSHTQRPLFFVLPNLRH